MSLLYKSKEQQSVFVDIKTFPDGTVSLDFSSDCGKFGAEEPLAYYKLTTKRLLEILHDRDDYTDDEL